MRPQATLPNGSPRSRKLSNEPSTAPSTAPTSFFLARDLDTDKPTSSTTIPTHSSPSPVRTLRQTIEEAELLQNPVSDKAQQSESPNNGRRRSTIKPKSIDDLRAETGRHQPHLFAEILIPPSQPSHNLSIPSSPKSLSSRSVLKSDDELTQDETNSQAVASSEEDVEEKDISLSIQDSAPQLIMPSIKMPSRRPFTARGKQLGRYKIMVAGSPGSGKTSLIKSIVQLCEDIVHVDPLTANTSMRTKGQTRQTRTEFIETYASTKSYPTWWSDVDESRILKRRKSMGDAVLERNVCFVDILNSGKVERSIHYLEQQLMKTMSHVNQASTDLTALLSGKGGSQVDIVLYLLTLDTLNEDCEQIRRISRLTNVVPLISKSDLLSRESMDQLRSALDESTIALPHLPVTPQSHLPEGYAAAAPYEVSSANGPDVDNMDASLLMSPEYVQPLIPSELGLVVDAIFDPDTVTYLRHTASRKIVHWYNTEPRLNRTPSPSMRSPAPSTLNSPLQTSMTQSGLLIPVISEASLNTSNSFALAKVADHSQREERLAQIRLSKWASDLQLSLQRERERYESIARGERALWLVQRMGEEIRDGQILPVDHSQAVVKLGDKARLMQMEDGSITYQLHDPLGLLRLKDDMRARGWIALQIVGGFGVISGLAVWLAKICDMSTSLNQWAKDWGVWGE